MQHEAATRAADLEVALADAQQAAIAASTASDYGLPSSTFPSIARPPVLLRRQPVGRATTPGPWGAGDRGRARTRPQSARPPSAPPGPVWIPLGAVTGTCTGSPSPIELEEVGEAQLPAFDKISFVRSTKDKLPTKASASPPKSKANAGVVIRSTGEGGR